MKHSELITVAILAAAFVIYKIIGKTMFTYIFATTFIVLFLAPIVILWRSSTTGKKFNGMLNTYKENQDIECARQLIIFLEKNKYKGAVDHKFHTKMKDFYALAENDPQLTQDDLNSLKAALTIYNIRINPEIDETLLETS